MSGRDYDVVVVGGGHNGLVAAALLQRRGARVALFEARAELGGFAASLSPGGDLDAPLAVDDWGLFRDDLVAELDLARHGLSWVAAERLATLCGSTERGAASGAGDLPLWCDGERCAEALEREAPGDGAKMRRFLAEIAAVLGELEELWRGQPELAALGRFVLSPALLRWSAGSLEELLGAAFAGTRARTAMAALALRGSAWGPSAAGTGILLLHQLAGTSARGLRPARRPHGGAGAFVAALERAATEAGVAIRRAAPVRQVLVEGAGAAARATGVRLADGTEVSARLVLSGLDRRSTLLGLVGTARLPVQSVRHLRCLRHRGARGRSFVPVAAGGGPRFGDDGAPWLLVDGLEHLERAADDAKWRRPSTRPWLEVSAWPGRTGGGTLTVNAQSAPQVGVAGSETVWSAAVRAQFGRLGRNEVPRHELAPADWERELGAAGGCEHHGDMLLDQTFLLRGTERAAGASTEVAGLLLCGSGAHPGGGVTGLPGWHAAELAAKELA